MPKVLLVDTEPHIGALLKSRFEQEGFEVSSLLAGAAEDGPPSGPPGAPPDLIVWGKRQGTAQTLEDFMSGVATGVPVILLTSADTLEDAEAVTLHDVARLKMPFRPSHLLELARRAVARA